MFTHGPACSHRRIARAIGGALLLALAGCGGPGYANFHPNTAAIVTTPTPNSGDFINEADSVSATGGAATVSVTATYVGTLSSGDTASFDYPFTVTLDGASYSAVPSFTYTSTTVSANPGQWFGSLNIDFRNLGVGSHTVAIHFGTLPGFTGVPLADLSIPVTITANG